MIKQLKITKKYKDYVYDKDSEDWDQELYEEIEVSSVQDLIKFLNQFPFDMSVLISWEGIYCAMRQAKIIKNEDGEKALLINVDSTQDDCFENESLEF